MLNDFYNALFGISLTSAHPPNSSFRMDTNQGRELRTELNIMKFHSFQFLIRIRSGNRNPI